ncbi:unnamed protein product [Pleuronectes platessa]|uniref:SERTA domain-containing protein n=1 Tax=Pleuronectes platessa TaxID=8262 RepID=A0A9N7ULU5_PLEPL|nr:unnamed protein product [Pleuronectes platessa]
MFFPSFLLPDVSSHLCFPASSSLFPVRERTNHSTTSKVAYFKRKYAEEEDLHGGLHGYFQKHLILQEDRSCILKLSLEKLRFLEDPEAYLRRSVLINNLLRKIHHEEEELEAEEEEEEEERRRRCRGGRGGGRGGHWGEWAAEADVPGQEEGEGAGDRLLLSPVRPGGPAALPAAALLPCSRVPVRPGPEPPGAALQPGRPRLSPQSSVSTRPSPSQEKLLTSPLWGRCLLSSPPPGGSSR